ncbi:hypothetical protein ABW20_dc0105940 [Dactylellina cionopaga]|nr:hypothetical protein ABW20_dc0105940 [Dactylellina cionopaga]
MDPNAQEDLSSHQVSIVYCPSCGASVGLPVVPPSNAGLYCDICTSPDLLVSTNDGVDWNPLSDAFNALSLGAEQNAPAPVEEASGAEPQLDNLEIDSITPTIQEEMKRRSLILSELMNFRGALYTGDYNDPQMIEEEEPTGESSGNTGQEMVEDDATMSNMARTFHELLDLRRRSGMFLLDEVNTLPSTNLMTTEEEMLPVEYMQGAYPNGQYHQLQDGEEEGMYDDPPIEYVMAHPPVQEERDIWSARGADQTQPNANLDLPSGNNDDDDDDDEGQVYATPEQREEMRARRKELRMNMELREQEMLWRKYGVGGLGVSKSN